MAESEQAKVSNAGRAHVDVVAEEAAAAATQASQSTKTKEELVAEAEAAGVEVKPGDTKADIAAKLKS
jgi:hypothetical protein